MKQAQIVGNKDMPLIEANNIDHVAPDRGQRVGFHLHVFKRSWYILPFGNVSQHRHSFQNMTTSSLSLTILGDPSTLTLMTRSSSQLHTFKSSRYVLSSIEVSKLLRY